MKLRLENKESERVQELGNLIRAYNRSKREASTSEPLNIFVEDEDGNLIGGLVAETYLYVSEDLRGQGLGSHILQKAEEEARDRKCKYSFVDTFHFQAPDFYKKHCYEEVFRLKEYPYTGERYYYTKEL